MKAKKKAAPIKKAFISKLSYGMRSPLHAIIGFSELISSKKVGEINRKQKEYLNDIISSAKELLNFLHSAAAMTPTKARPRKKSKKSGKKKS